MDPIEKIISLFHASIEARASHGEHLAYQLAGASELMANTFVNDGRVLLCGNASAAISAQYFATALLNQGSRERPGLPAQLLDANPALLAAIGQSYGDNEIFSRQIQALGREGDVLVIYTATGSSQNLINAVQAAHEKNMRVIFFSGNDGGHVAQLLDAKDVEITAPIASEFLTHEIHLLMSFILCDLIDDHLFGVRT
jgi:D-sedoheptulose 7-phosphate isomerase